ncbi:hypothetical protein AOY38_10565 [Synechocystis sp. PCC 6803]|nr:hypothetical protein AOY38_10565 [Synechocystis sp. PCC 6803]AVP90075.1 hypothetical protein C7I86_10600 [Synechocystis sp. IPPAS B-1465]
MGIHGSKSGETRTEEPELVWRQKFHSPTPNMSYGKAFCLIFLAIICTTWGGSIQLVQFSAGNAGSSHGFQR